MIYSFEDFELDTDQLELRRGGETLNVEPQVFSLLELLVGHAHRAVSKEEINEKVWGGRIVSEAALSSRIRSARRALARTCRACDRLDVSAKPMVAAIRCGIFCQLRTNVIVFTKINDSQTDIGPWIQLNKAAHRFGRFH